MPVLRHGVRLSSRDGIRCGVIRPVGFAFTRRHNMNSHDNRSIQETSTGKQMTGKDSRMEVGFRKGIRTFFDIDGITIALWGSAWTGREIVTVDDRVVSRKWSLRLVTPHHFEH